MQSTSQPTLQPALQPTSQPLWTPSAARAAASNLASFMQRAGFADYDALWQWSVEQSTDFWPLVWEHCGAIGERGARVLVNGEQMPGASWFPDARLNYAENLLRPTADDAADALVFWGESKVQRRMSRGELAASVSRLRQALQAAGVGLGDRVAGFLPNMPETVAAMLATASLGAIWSSASPDFGVQGVLDRFGQIDPKVLFVVDGYWYNGKAIDCMAKNAEVAARLPGLGACVVVSYLAASTGAGGIERGITWEDFIAPYAPQALEFARLPFDHPLYIMFSSGTTGVPKCIVHGHGGTLLQHLKEQQLHGDVKPGDRLFYFTTCGWMMWNWLVSGLASGATLLLYDGSPFVAGADRRPGSILFDYADAEGMTHFGTSAKFIDALAKAGLTPQHSHRLRELRSVFSTGSPLSPEGFAYVYQAIKPDVALASISGGTDIISCFVLGNPLLPVWPGEIQSRGLGMAVEVFDEDGNPLRAGSGSDGRGELVCTRPFPAMPIGFWNDADGSKYRAAYFERFANVWCHGDFAEITVHNGVIIHGRSDATLNPGGVRIGTAEIYRQVEKLPEIAEALVIGQEWKNDVRVVLFVKLQPGAALDERLIAAIKQQIRDNATQRHVPAKILQVADIPRTKSGKIVELAVKNIVHGREVKNREALANPEALDHFRDRPELRT